MQLKCCKAKSDFYVISKTIYFHINSTDVKSHTLYAFSDVVLHLKYKKVYIGAILIYSLQFQFSILPRPPSAPQPIKVLIRDWLLPAELCSIWKFGYQPPCMPSSQLMLSFEDQCHHFVINLYFTNVITSVFYLYKFILK